MAQPGIHGAFAYALSSVLPRLVVAAVLGGAIGLERELHHRPAGLRTHIFICFGAALFTVLSEQLAGSVGGDHTRIAAQIIPGIGFIGAGSILHARGAISGLTTAATIFVVAAIGMACGGGMYIAAVFATVIILLSLVILGMLEERFSLKPLTMAYEVHGANSDDIVDSVNGVLEDEHKMMQTVQIGKTGDHYRVQFTVVGTKREQSDLLLRLQRMPRAEKVECLGITDRE